MRNNFDVVWKIVLYGIPAFSAIALLGWARYFAPDPLGNVVWVVFCIAVLPVAMIVAIKQMSAKNKRDDEE